MLFFSFSIKINNISLFLFKIFIYLFFLLQFFNFSNSQFSPLNQQNNEVLAAVYSSQRRELIYNGENENNKSEEIIINKHCFTGKPCKSGLIIPLWEPQDVSLPIRLFRAFIYLLALLYLFYGISIVSDRFMAAIEVITSQEREVEVTKVTGEKIKVLVRVWNETVSNLTLMALGSSAPEILLSVIEIFGNNFEAGDLGPSTIVGSAAFNLFIIVGICIMIVPSNEIRRIDRIDVFWVTVIWSTFAYIWLFLILCVFSPNIVEVWEGLLTLVFFPLTVGSAFIANKHAKTFGQRILGANAITSFRHTPRLGKHQSTHVGIRANGSEKDIE
uniref:Na_Ca_ex domain-containing protein n=1 Tax=Meloidogyne hapla TaxID=6305 RepID=A0A1I8BQW2_MELHA